MNVKICSEKVTWRKQFLAIFSEKKVFNAKP